MKRKTPKDRERTRSLLQALQMIEKPRAKTPSGMAKTSIWLPGEMLDWLKEEAAERGIGMADEIRGRLAASWRDDLADVDAPTVSIEAVLKTASTNISGAFAPWHQDPFAFAVFREVLNRALAAYKPPGDPNPVPRSKGWAETVLGPGPYTVEKAVQFFMGALFASGNLPEPEQPA